MKYVKVILGFLLIALMPSSVLAAYAGVLSNESPVDGSIIPGSSSEPFSIQGTTMPGVALVYIDWVGYVLSCSGAGPFTCSANVDLTGLGEGVYDYIYFVDGTFEPAPITPWSVEIDRTIPLTSIAAVQAGGITDNTIDYTATCTDLNLDTCTVYVDDGTSNTTLVGLIGTTAALPDDTYTFWTVGLDLAGNRGESVSAPIVVDAAPTAPTGLVVTSLTDTSLNADWNNNPETDLVTYTVYYIINGVGIDINNPLTYDGTDSSMGTTSTFNHIGLTTGDNVCYVVTASDATTESLASAEVCAVVADLTPPGEPVVTPSSGTCDNLANTCTIPILNPTFTIDYTGTETANVNLTVLSGGSEIAKLYNAMTFNWPFAFGANGTYLLDFKAEDSYGNSNTVPYTMYIGGSTVNMSIVDLIHITTIPFTVKGTALANGVDWIVLGFDVSAYGGDFVRVQMSDLLSAGGNILINEDSAPTAFCAVDYDLLTQDIIGAPVYNTYAVDNTYNEAVNALDCPDTNPSGLTEYDVYVKIPVPAGAASGPYTSTVDFGLYSTVI